jgi:hypothetical protein
LFATSFAGAITGRRADYIFVDDPLEIKDASNSAQMERVANLFETEIFSRLNNPRTGRIVVTGHRLHELDLSGHLLAQSSGRWTHFVLPLIATCASAHEIQHGTWYRGVDELLRHDAFTVEMIDELRRREVDPDFETLYQQNPGAGTAFRIQPADFGSFAAHEVPDAAVVISIEPGQSGGPRNSFSVIQVWTRRGAPMQRGDDRSPLVPCRCCLH